MDFQYVLFSEQDKSISFKRGYPIVTNMMSKDKAEMAWRHRSRQEKLLLRVIAFLCFVLAAFIITVIAMDLAYKSEIKKLEDEVQAMKSTPPVITSTEVITTLSTSSKGSTTTSLLPLTTTDADTTPAVSEETTTDQEVSTSTDETTEGIDTDLGQEDNAVASDGLLQALRALMTSFSKTSDSYSSSERKPERRPDIRRTKGTFILLADLVHEETPNQLLKGQEGSIKRWKEKVKTMKVQSPPNATSPSVNQSVTTTWNEILPISTLPSISTTHEHPRVPPRLLPTPTLPINLDPTVSHSIDSADEEYRRFGTSTPAVK